MKAILRRLGGGRKTATRVLAVALAVGVMLGFGVGGGRPAWAAECEDGQVETAILGGGGCYDPGTGGEGIMKILGTVLDFLTYGVGTLGVVGIVIASIQYITAAGNEAQMTKAKQRILEVVIGLIAWGLMYAFLQWLVPGGVF